MAVEMGGMKFEAVSSAGTGLQKIDPKTLDFNGSALFVNRTSRFVLAIPDLGDQAELLTYPEGDKAGQPMKTTDSGEPDRGVIFFNGKDQAWQAVRANGNEAILINDVSKEDADLIKVKLDSIVSSCQKLTLANIKEVLEFARNDLGLVDFYNKKLDSIAKDMVPSSEENPYYMTVTKTTEHRALYVDKPFIFDGPVQQQYPDGAVLVTDGIYTWGVATDVFIKNFREVRGNEEIPLSSTDVLLKLQ